MKSEVGWDNVVESEVLPFVYADTPCKITNQSSLQNLVLLINLLLAFRASGVKDSIMCLLVLKNVVSGGCHGETTSIYQNGDRYTTNTTISIH